MTKCDTEGAVPNVPKKVVVIDPPSGWMYGFPRIYNPEPDETIEAWLLRHGYPQHQIDQGMHKHCRYWDFVPDTKVVRSKLLKCTKCHHEWQSCSSCDYPDLEGQEGRCDKACSWCGAPSEELPDA